MNVFDDDALLPDGAPPLCINGVQHRDDGFVVHLDQAGIETTLHVPAKRQRVDADDADDAEPVDRPDPDLVMQVLHGVLARNAAEARRAAAWMSYEMSHGGQPVRFCNALATRDQGGKPSYLDVVVRDKGVDGGRSTTSFMFPVDSTCARFNSMRSMVVIDSWATMPDVYVAGAEGTMFADVNTGLAVRAQDLKPVAGAPAHCTLFPHGILNCDGGVRRHVVTAATEVQIVARIKLPLGFKSHTDLMDFFNAELAAKYADFTPITMTKWQWVCYLVAGSPSGVTDPLTSHDDAPEFNEQAQSEGRYKDTRYSLLFRKGMDVKVTEDSRVIERCFATPDEHGVLRFPAFQFRSQFLQYQLRGDAKAKNGVRFYVTPSHANLYKHAPLSALSEMFVVQSSYVHSEGQGKSSSRNHLLARAATP